MSKLEAVCLFAICVLFTACGSTPSSRNGVGLDAYCSMNGGCVDDWTAAQEAGSWCIRGSADAGTSTHPRLSILVLPDCGGYNVVDAAGVDTGTLYLYDEVTGKLIGVADAGTWTCIAGSCPAERFSLACDDVG